MCQSCIENLSNYEIIMEKCIENLGKIIEEEECECCKPYYIGLKGLSMRIKMLCLIKKKVLNCCPCDSVKFLQVNSLFDTTLMNVKDELTRMRETVEEDLEKDYLNDGHYLNRMDDLKEYYGIIEQFEEINFVEDDE